FPPHPPAVTVESLSALTGFNNNVSIVALPVGVALLTAIGWRRKLRPQLTSSQAMPMHPLLVMCAIQTLFTSAIAISVSARPPAAEAYYFLDRLYPLAAGMVPYRDFEFLYGPLLLYIPYWTSRILGVPLYPAYLAVFLLFQLIGLAMLWKIIGLANVPARTRS